MSSVCTLMYSMIINTFFACMIPVQYASVEQKGERYMTANDFVVRYLGFLPESNANPKSLTLLGNILDTSKDGLISFREFEAYEGLLCHPEAIYRLVLVNIFVHVCERYMKVRKLNVPWQFAGYSSYHRSTNI